MDDQLKRYASGSNIYPPTTLDKVKLSDISDKSLKDFLVEGNLTNKDVDVVIDESGWKPTASSGYSKVIDVDGITEDISPLYVLKTSEYTEDEIASFAEIHSIITYDGQIVVYSNKIPSTKITITLKGIPAKIM